MIEVRCPHCGRLALEVSGDTQGVIRTRCKRPNCQRYFTKVLLPAAEVFKVRVGKRILLCR